MIETGEKKTAAPMLTTSPSSSSDDETLLPVKMVKDLNLIADITKVEDLCDNSQAIHVWCAPTVLRLMLIPCRLTTAKDLKSFINFLSLIVGYVSDRRSRFDDPETLNADKMMDTGMYLLQESFEVPTWFIELHKRFSSVTTKRSRLLPVDFYEYCVNFIMFAIDNIKTKVTLGVNLDATMKDLANSRKMEGLKIQIQGLKRGLRQARAQNNENKCMTLTDEINHIKDRLKQLRSTMSKDVVSPSNDGSENSSETPGEVVVVTDHASNTAIATATGEDCSAVTENPPDVSFTQEIFSDQVFQYPALTNRYVKFFSTQINRSVTRGQTIAQIHLPHDFLVSNFATPNTLPFRNHMWFTGGMKVKFAWNMAKTQQCYVQFGVVWHLLQRDRYSELQTVQPVSQQPGGFLNGHMQNSTEIDIDYLSYLPVIPTVPNNFAMPNYYCTITVKAFTNFEYGVGDTASADLIGYLAFKPDFRFYGQRPTQNTIFAPLTIPVINNYDIVSPSMMASAALIGSRFKKDVSDSVTSSVRGIGSRLVGSANNIVRGTVSRATGALTGAIERTTSNALPNRRSNRDKATDHSNIALHQRTTTNIASGSGHYAADSFRLNTVSTVPHPDFLVGVEKFHNLMPICRTFGFVNSFRVSKNNVSGDALIRLRTQPGASGTSFVQNVTYLFNNVFPNEFTPVDHIASMFRCYSGDMEYKFVVVNNGFTTCRLRVVWVPAVTLLPAYVDTNSFYYRIFDVGPDLETQLTFTQQVPYVNAHINYPLTDEELTNIYSGSLAIYLETALSSPTGVPDGFDVLVFRRAAPNFALSIPSPMTTAALGGPGGGDGPNPPVPPTTPTIPIDVIAYARGGTPNTPAELTVQMGSQIINTTMGQATTRAYKVTGSTSYFNSGVEWGGDATHPLVTIFRSPTDTPATITLRFFLNPGDAPVEAQVPIEFLGRDPPRAIITFDYTGPTPSLIVAPLFNELENPDKIFPANDGSDSRFDAHGLEAFNPSGEPLVSGLQGEDFMDINNNLRRFEHFNQVTIDVPNARTKTLIYRLLVNTGMSSIRSEQDLIQRRNKVTSFGDMFRFARTSIRHVISVSYTGRPGILVLRHVPLVRNLPVTKNSQLQETPYVSSGYGESIHALQQNPVIAIETPGYFSGNCLLNASYLTSNFATNFASSLGVIEFYWLGEAQRLDFDIKRALADDCEWYGFNGIPVRAAVNGGSLFYSSSNLPTSGDEEADKIYPSLNVVPKETTAKIDTLCDDATTLINTMKDFIESLATSDKPTESLTTVVLQMCQVIHNPTVTTLALSVTQILVTLRIVKIQMLASLSGLISRYIDKIGLERHTVSPAMIDDDLEEAAELSAVILSGVATLFSPTKKVGRFENFVVSFGSASTIHMRILEFLKTLFGYIRRCAAFVCERLFPESKFASYLNSGGKEQITEWLRRTQVVIDPTVYNRLKQNAKSVSLVYWLITMGEELSLKTAYSKSRNTKIGQLITTNLIALKKVREKLARLTGVPSAKYDPYVLYLSGVSSIGKSILLERISTKLASEVFEIHTEGDPFFTVPCDKYWENYNNHSVIIFDDFNRLVPNDPAESDLVRLCGLKGNAQFVIPKAYDDKGVVSVAKLISIASNYSHPQMNNLKPEVVWNRRNICWSVIPNFEGLATCSVHSNKISLHCPNCTGQPGNQEILSCYAHLQFQQYDPLTPNVTWGEPVGYEEFLKRTIANAKAYNVRESVAFSERVQRAKVLSKNAYKARQEGTEPEISDEFVIPSSPFDHLNVVLEEADVDAILAELGGPMTAISPCMMSTFKKFLGFHSGTEDEEEVEETIYDRPECCHSDITIDDEIEYASGSYYWLEHKDLKGNILTGEPCGNYCSWQYREVDFFREILEKCKLSKSPVPKFFPIRFRPIDTDAMVEEALNRVENQNWFRTLTSINWYTAALATVIGAGIGVLTFMVRREVSQEREEVVCEDDVSFANLLGIPSPKLSSPETEGACLSLMASDDVKTMFKSTPRRPPLKVHLRTLPRSRATPSNTDELNALYNTYRRSCLRVNFGGVYRALFVCVSPGVYITQFHAMAKLITDVKSRAEAMKAQGATSEEIDAECVMTLIKEDNSGKTSMRVHRFSDLIMQNLSYFNVMADGSDMCVFRFFIEEFQTANIGKYLIKQSEYEYMSDDNKSVVSSNVQKVEIHSIAKINNIDDYVVIDNKEAKDWCPKIGDNDLQLRLVGYTAPSPFGMDYKTRCGSILVDKATCKVIGILSAASQNKIYFNAITYELFTESGLLPNVKDRHGNHVMLREEILPSMQPIQDQINQTVIAIPRMQVHQSMKTTIRKSVCFEEFGEVVRAPCILQGSDDPKGLLAVVRGLRNYKPHIAFPDADIQASYIDLKNLYRAKCVPVMPVVSERSIRTAIEGIAGMIPKLKMSTSPGFPWTCRPDTNRKSDLICFDETRTKVVSIHKDLIDMIEVEEKLMDEGVVPFTVHQIALKDERLKLEKLHNIRIIQGSPFSLTITARKFLMDFNYAFQCSRNDLEHCVGINPESDEWDTLARKLLANSPYICVGDYSKFGPRLLNQFVEKAYDVRNDWYDLHGASQRDRQMRNILAKRVINSTNIVDRQIFSLECGSPSGAIDTVITNSQCNQQYIRCAWIGIMRKYAPKFMDLRHFNENVCFFCYGDDVIFSVKEAFINIFNNQTLHDYFAQYDVSYTDVAKDGSIRPYCSLEESTFLKLGFHHFKETSIPGGLWICRPNIADLLDSTNWVRKPKGMPDNDEIERALIEATHVNCSNSLRKMWFWGREYFEEFKQQLESFWVNFSYRGERWKPPSFDFDALQAEFGFPPPIEGSVTFNAEYYIEKYGYPVPDPENYVVKPQNYIGVELAPIRPPSPGVSICTRVFGRGKKNSPADVETGQVSVQHL